MQNFEVQCDISGFWAQFQGSLRNSRFVAKSQGSLRNLKAHCKSFSLCCHLYSKVRFSINVGLRRLEPGSSQCKLVVPQYQPTKQLISCGLRQFANIVRTLINKKSMNTFSAEIPECVFYTVIGTQ
jgi:hypothetical protein